MSLTLSELAGVVIPDSGMKARLPPFENEFKRECRLDRVEEAEIASGVARITCTNHTEVTFDSLVAWGELGSVCFRDLKPGDSRSVRIDVGGIVVNSPMQLSFVAGSPGTGTDTIQLKKTDSVSVGFELDSLHLSDYLLVDYRNPEGKSVNLYVAYYASQLKGESIHSPATSSIVSRPCVDS